MKKIINHRSLRYKGKTLLALVILCHLCDEDYPEVISRDVLYRQIWRLLTRISPRQLLTKSQKKEYNGFKKNWQSKANGSDKDPKRLFKLPDPKDQTLDELIAKALNWIKKQRKELLEKYRVKDGEGLGNIPDLTFELELLDLYESDLLQSREKRRHHRFIEIPR